MFDLTRDDFFTNVKSDMEPLDNPEYLINGNHNDGTTLNLEFSIDGEIIAWNTNRLPWDFPNKASTAVVDTKYFNWDFDKPNVSRKFSILWEEPFRLIKDNNMVRECRCGEPVFPWDFDVDRRCPKCEGMKDITDEYLIYLNSLNYTLNIAPYYIDPMQYLGNRHLIGGNIRALEEIELRDNNHILVPPWLQDSLDIRIFESDAREFRGENETINALAAITANNDFTTVRNISLNAISTVDSVPIEVNNTTTDFTWTNTSVITNATSINIWQ